jgi:DNA-binding NarL/FixJ family response regulator
LAIDLLVSADAVRVVVVDAHPTVRLVLRTTFEACGTIELVGEAATGFEALDLCRQLDPDVLVLDPDLPDIGGMDVARQLSLEGSRARIVVLSAREDMDERLATSRVGADTYLVKTCGPEDVATAVKALASGRGVFTSEQRRNVHAGLLRLARQSWDVSVAASRLTPRQRQLLALLTRGLTNRQIARNLGISERTVHDHIVGLYERLGVRSRTQALHRASALGLVRIR